MKRLKTKKKVKIIFCCVILVVLAIAGFTMYYINLKKYDKYIKYEEPMNMYGFSSLYNNESPKSNENISYIEAVKIVIAAAYNNETSVKALNEEHTTTEEWTDFAKALNILPKEDVNYNNLTLVDAIYLISEAKNNLLSLDIESSVKPEFSDYDKYERKQKYCIMDLVSSEIIENSKDKLDGNRKLKKGEFNELIVKFVEKFALTVTGANLRDEEKQPENASEYPYTIEEVDKEIYEQAYTTENKDDFILPIDLYKYEKGNYDEIVNTCQNYYNSLLNVDYRNINKEDFIKKIEGLVIFEVDEEAVQKYVDYIKNNKIVVSGSATVQLPIIYSDGINVRVRTKLDFKVESPNNVFDNVLYLDDQHSSILRYKPNNTIYIDAMMGYVIGSDKLYNKSRVVYSMILDKYKDNIENIGK